MKEDLIISHFREKYPLIEKWLGEAKISGINPEDYLFSKNLISSDELLEFKAKVFNLPIKKFEIEEVLPKEALEKVPEATAKNHKILPLEFKQNILYLGVVDPEIPNLQEKVINFLKEKYKIDIQFFLISIKDFYIHLEDYYDFETEIKKLVLDWRSAAGRKIEKEKAVSFTEGVISAQEGPVIKLFEFLIRKAVSLKASDIHLEPLPDKARVRFRLYGDLKNMVFLPKDIHLPLVNRVKILTNLRLDETRITQDGRFRANVQGREIDFRVGILPTINGEKVAIRILDPLVGLKKISELGLADYHYQIVERNLKKSFGLILITGPTGSGKTTTLYALVQEVNKEKINIISLEDPVEYKIIGINQSQVRPEIGYTFAKGLREILRQDPDVILVGEVRDEETAELVTHAALTGHLVFSSLHTNTATGAIPRLIDMGIKPYFIPSVVNLVITQRLVRLLCSNCLEEKEVTPEILKEVEKVLAEAPKEYQNLKIKSFQSKGCTKCNQKGYIGRIGIFELFEMTKEVAEATLRGGGEQEIIEAVKRQNFISLRLDGIIKASKGLVLLEEVFQVA